MNRITHAEHSFPSPSPSLHDKASFSAWMSDSTDLLFPVGCVIHNNAALTLYIDYEV